MLIVKLFQPEALDGRDWWFTDPPGYEVNEAELQVFDQTFSPKEKLVLPGQLGSRTTVYFGKFICNRSHYSKLCYCSKNKKSKVK